MARRITLEALLAVMSEEMRAAFFTSIQSIVDDAVLRDVEQAVASGDAQRLVDLLGFNPASLRPISRAFQSLFEKSGDWTNADYPRINGFPVFRFDMTNPRAERWIATASSGLITRTTEDVRANIRTVLDEGIRLGRNPRDTALDIIGRIDPVTKRRVGGLIGLTPSQLGWSQSVRRDLEGLNPRYFDKALRDKRFDRTVRAALRDGKPLPKSVIDKLVYRYMDNALRFRGEQIARTESLAALAAAEFESLQQLIEKDVIRERDVSREWDTVGDTDVRHTHREMDGQAVGAHEPFTSPSGAKLLHPRDASLGAPASEIVACRCRVKNKIDWTGATLRGKVDG